MTRSTRVSAYWVLRRSGCLLPVHIGIEPFLRVMKASPLFATTSPDFVEELSHAAIDRIYMPGDLIIEQGTKGDSMFIMVSGQAGVLAADRSTVTAENVKTAAGARVGTLH